MTHSLRVGVGRERITPELGGHLAGYGWDVFSDAVNDDLTVTAVALGDGLQTVVLISATVCILGDDVVRRLREEAARRYRLRPDQVLLFATHTHSGPYTYEEAGWGQTDEAYCEAVLYPNTLAAVESALSSMEPAELGINAVESHVGVNRREYGPDGIVDLGQNPWGQFDPTMTVLAFRAPDGRALANIVHYGAHCTAAGTHTEITRDWAGVMIDRLDAETGGVTLFLNGAAGDVGPRLTNGKTKGDLQDVIELGSVAAFDAVRAYRGIRQFGSAALRTVSDTISLPYRPLPPRALAKERLAYYSGLPDTNVHLHMKKYYADILGAYRNGPPREPALRLRQTLVEVGGILLIPIPFEAFSEISLRLRAYSPYPHTLCACYGNGSLSYLPSQDQLCRGGYEVEMFRTSGVQTLADDTDSQLIRETLRLVQQLRT